MNLNPIAAPLRPLVLAVITLGLCATASQAQLKVDMSFTKKKHVAHEAVEVTVTVRNLSGQDVVLSQPGGGGWLDFTVTSGNRGLSRRPGAPIFKPIALKAGSKISKSIDLGQYYPLALPDSYAVTASVYYGPMKKFISSSRQLFYVTRARPFWAQTFGIQNGNRPIEFRKYTLLLYNDKHSSVYVRVSSDDDSMVYATYSLGNLLNNYDPKVDVDAANRLHILHLTSPKIYTHSIIGPDGTPESQKFYKETARSRPTITNRGGGIRVSGGVPFDPRNPHGNSRPGIASPGDNNDPNRIRSATERPEGLPLPRR